MKSILYIATIISLITYLFWDLMPKGSFYIGNSLFILLLCSYLFFTDNKSFIKFILFSLSLNNFFDELLFNNTKLEINEILTAVSIIIFAFIKYKNDRKRTFDI